MDFIVDGWIEPADDGKVVLVGQRCERCATAYFPASQLCKRCSSADVVPIRLGPEAELHSYALDRMGTFLGYPHLVGQVRFAEGPFVQGYISAPADSQPVIGAAVDLVPFEIEVNGTPTLTYAFQTRSSD